MSVLMLVVFWLPDPVSRCKSVLLCDVGLLNASTASTQGLYPHLCLFLDNVWTMHAKSFEERERVVVSRPLSETVSRIFLDLSALQPLFMPSHTVHADCTVCALYDNVVPCRVREGVYLRGCRRGGVAHREGSTGGGSGAWPGPPSHGVLLAGRCRGQAGGEILPWVSILENRNALL